MTYHTVGQLKKLLATLPDDMRIGGYDGRDHQDYVGVSFYVVDRSKEADWETIRNDPKTRTWWEGDVPAKVLVCDTD